MRILTDWLREFVSGPTDPRELGALLTDVGLEVEEIHRFGDELDGLRTARIAGMKQHPHRGDLTVCELDANDRSGRVVTAATNLNSTDTYLWAPPGSLIPGRRMESESFVGVESEGMLLSIRDMGFSEQARHLIQLPGSCEIGRDACDLLDLDETILELDLTPNRSDCLSVLGVARDLAAALDRDVQTPEIAELPEDPPPDVEVQIEDPAACGAYWGLTVENVRVGTAPLPIIKRLLKLGVQPLNNLVDTTNYVLFERGHPLHPFDRDRLEPPVRVRRAEPEETHAALNDEEYELNPADLVIADRRGPRALAGVMGGRSSAVTDTTESLFLEAARFDPGTVRRTARRHKLHTDASHRFERGVDPRGIEPALGRCLSLFAEDPHLDPSELIVHAPSVAEPGEVSAVRISFEPGDFEALIGYDPGTETIRTRLERLGCSITTDDGDWTVESPTWRHDLTRPEDLLEEVVRLDGYDSVPARYPRVSLEETREPSSNRERRVRRFLADAGFNEVVTFSFRREDEHRFVNGEEPHRLRNPLSREHETMRQSLLDGMTLALCENRDAGESNLRLFEIGRVFPGDRREEPRSLGLLAEGALYEESWDENARSFDFFDLKGTINTLFHALGLEEPRFEPAESPGFVPGQTARLLHDGNPVGRVGRIHPDRLDLKDEPDVWGAELTLSELPEATPPRFEPYSTQPIVKRDLDLVVDEERPVGELREAIREGARWLESIKVFDLYRGDPLPEGTKSVSFNLRFRKSGETLSDDEVTDVQDTILSELRDRFDARLRDE